MLTKEKFKASLTFFFVLLVENLLFANTIVVGVSFSIPPYVIEETDQGVELEILREAFKIKGHTVKVKYLPLARTFMQLGSGKIDGVINIKKGMLKNVFYTDVVITFQNCAISLKKRGFPDFTDLNSLKGMYVIAFQRASYILGPEFGEMTKDNNQYEETALQKTQLFRLFMERNADLSKRST
ncbi:MAG: hypothetical protein GY714_02990 [Desulfobacterales bacterium]|nr:hypothetical protein [Desulfobacterales bacterium]